MKKNLIFFAIFLFMGFMYSMEERKKPYRVPIIPNIKTYFDKLPRELKDIINKYRVFELEQLPDELLIPILSQLTKGKNLEHDIGAMCRLRLLNKRFNNLVNNIAFVDMMINFLSAKYKVPGSSIAILWNTPGTKEWLKLQDRADLAIMMVELNGERRPFRPLLQLAVKSNAYDVIAILLEKGFDINEVDQFGQTVLTFVLEDFSRNSKMIKFLIDKGAGVNKRENTREGNTPLMIAILYNRPDLIRILLENKADPNKPNTRGETPIVYLKYLRDDYMITNHAYEQMYNLLKGYGAKK